MPEDLRCYRCGESLAALTPPISRHDACPSCLNYLHVCRMCVYFDASAPRQCLEDDAEDVVEKEKLNFCEWYKPSPAAFDPAHKSHENKASNELQALFGDGPDNEPDDDENANAAEDLFH
jgi:hypothetical protein